MKNDKIFQRFCLERGIRKSTIDDYYYILNAYTEFNGMSLSELLNEADEEELQGKRWKDRTLRLRLLSYRSHLYNNTELMENTIKTKMTVLKIFYNHFDIEMGKLPSFNAKTVRKSKPITAEDIPNKEMIKKAMSVVSNQAVKHCIHFMSATGLARVDATDLIVQDFLTACEEYYSSTDLNDALKELSQSEDAIGQFHLQRRKTSKWFYTFCTTEVVNNVADYLLTRKNLERQDKLFEISKPTFYRQFTMINKKLNLGKDSDGKWWFRSHKLRKFHSKQLKEGVDGMSVDDIDALQGRAKDRTHETYHIIDPVELKKKYLLHMHKLCLFSEVEVKTFESDEYKELKRENENYRSRLDKQEDMLRELSENHKRLKEMFDLN